MRTHRVLAAAAAVLALGIAFLTVGRADDDDKDLRPAADKLVKSGVEKPDALPKAGAEFAKANGITNDSIKSVMDLLGRREPKAHAWGVGRKPGDIKMDGIEIKIRELAKKPLGKDQLAKEADALVEMAHRTAAVGAVALARPPEKALPCKDPKDWKQYSEDMVKMSREFAKAVKSKDADAIVKAAGNLNATCSDCHSKFRE